MIEEEAYVADVAQGVVWIKKTSRMACSGCVESCSNSLAGKLFGEKQVFLKVPSELPLQPGDKILLGIPEEALARGLFWVYLAPLFSLFIGAILGNSINGSDLTSFFGGLIGMSLYYAGLKFTRFHDRENCRPVVLRKID